MRRQILCAAVCLSAMFCTMPVSAAGSEFHDTAGHWAKTQIHTWAERGVVSGYNGAFRPNDPITRGEAATIINNIMRYPSAGGNPFTDLEHDRFYTQPVLKLVYAGVMSGYPDHTVRAEHNITRQEAATLLANAFCVEQGKNSVNLPFQDKNQIAAYALDTIRSMSEKGYISGYPDKNFRPTAEITRAEFVAILENMIVQLQPADGTGQTHSEKMLVINQPGVTVSNQSFERILITAGVGEGNVVLDNVTADAVYVQGGGVNSIIIQGNSQIRSIQISKLDSGVRVKVTGDALVEVTQVMDGCDDVILSGSFRNVAIDSATNTIRFTDAKVSNLTITGEQVEVFINSTSNVKALSIADSADHTTVTSEGVIGSVHVDNPSVQVSVSKDHDTSSGGGGNNGGSSGGSELPDKPVQTIFGMTILISEGGTVFAEVVEDEGTPDIEPDEPPVTDPVDPEEDGYPLVIQTGGHGIAIAEVVEEVEEDPVIPEEPGDYVARIEVVGQGSIIIEEVGG